MWNTHNVKHLPTFTVGILQVGEKIRHKAFKQLKYSSNEFNRVCNTPDQVNVAWLSASHFYV